MKRVITEEVVAREFAAGARRISAPPADTVITPSAWSKARELGVSFADVPGERPQRPKLERPHNAPTHSAPTHSAPSDAQGYAERIVDPSGVTVVRSKSVQLGKFTGAGPQRNIDLLDLVTASDGSPMTAGIMGWSRDDSFPWHLDYDEIDLVLEGVLQIQIEGRTIEGKKGDVLYIPKGSQIVFATPSHTRVFYVTYPANWAPPR